MVFPRVCRCFNFNACKVYILLESAFTDNQTQKTDLILVLYLSPTSSQYMIHYNTSCISVCYLLYMNYCLTVIMPPCSRIIACSRSRSGTPWTSFFWCFSESAKKVIFYIYIYIYICFITNNEKLYKQLLLEQLFNTTTDQGSVKATPIWARKKQTNKQTNQRKKERKTSEYKSFVWNYWEKLYPLLYEFFKSKWHMKVRQKYKKTHRSKKSRHI